jgi:hypothetical protein
MKKCWTTKKMMGEVSLRWNRLIKAYLELDDVLSKFLTLFGIFSILHIFCRCGSRPVLFRMSLLCLIVCLWILILFWCMYEIGLSIWYPEFWFPIICENNLWKGRHLIFI